MSATVSTAFYLPVNTRVTDRAAIVAAFVQDLLCYDTVYVLTDQMAAIGPLLELMPAKVLTRAVGDGTIQFIHDRQILSWPVRVGYKGPVPVVPLASIPEGSQTSGFSQVGTSEIVRALAVAMEVPGREANGLAKKVERATRDFGGLPTSVEPLVDPSAPTLSEALRDRVKTYSQLAAAAPELGVAKKDLVRLQNNLSRPARSPLHTKTWKVTRLNTEPGWRAIEDRPRMSRKQASLFNLFVADRILGVLADLGEGHTIHTDETVEQVFRARLDAIRTAAGVELDEVLDVASFPLPLVRDPDGLDFQALLKARGSAAGRSFRKVVASRDSNPDTRLVQAYYKSLKHGLSDRFEVKLARFLVTTMADLGLGNVPVTSTLNAFLLDHLLSRADPRFFIDHALPRAIQKGDRSDQGAT